MNAIRPIVGLILVAVGIVVAVHTIIEPLYHVSSEANPYSPVWSFINPLTALAVILGVIFSCLRTRAIARKGGGAPISRAYLAANVQLYGFLFVGILFFWNWFNLLSPGFTAIGADTASLL